MGNYAGYAVVGNVTQDLVNSAIQIYWSSLGSAPSVALPSGVGATGSLTLLAPSVTLAPSPTNQVQVGVAVVGAVSVGSTSILVQLSATVSAPISVSASSGYLVPALDLSTATVGALTVQVLDGSTLPPTVLLSSSTMQAALQAVLNAIPITELQLAPPIVPASLSAQGVTATFTNVQAIPMAGVLAVVGDLAGYTTGDPSQLVNLFTTPASSGIVVTYEVLGGGVPGSYQTTTTGGLFEAHPNANAAATINGPAFISFLNGPVASKIVGLSAKGVTITKASFELNNYTPPFSGYSLPGIIFHANVSYSGLSGSVSIAFGIHEVAYTSTGLTSSAGTLKPPSWQFEAGQVSISVSWEVQLLADVIVAALALICPYVAGLCLVALDAFNVVLPDLLSGFDTQAQTQVNAGLSSNTTFSNSIPAAVSLPLPGTTQPICTIYPEAAISNDSVNVFALMQLPTPVATLQLNGLQVGGHVPASIGPWTFSIQAQPGYFRFDDPTIRVEWKVSAKGLTTNLSSDQPIAAAGSLTSTWDTSAPAYAHVDQWQVQASIYRLVPGGTQTIWTQTVLVTTNDLIDITSWYVTWSNHKVFIPAPKGPPGVYWSRVRKGVWHKTDPSQRCKNVLSAAIRRKGSLEYSNTAPVAANAAGTRRGVLCDACFFGGPHGTVFVP